MKLNLTKHLTKKKFCILHRQDCSDIDLLKRLRPPGEQAGGAETSERTSYRKFRPVVE